jgi:hypothetical protein
LAAGAGAAIGGLPALPSRGRSGFARQSDALAGSLSDLLPIEDELPEPLFQTAEGGRTAQQITDTFPNPPAAARRFVQWDWQGNAFRNFGATSGFATANGTTVIEVSLHLFGSPGAAAEALPFFADARVAALGLNLASVGTIGEQAAAITGDGPNGSEVTLYVRRASVLARVTGVAPRSDPSRDVVTAAQRFLARTSPDPLGRTVTVFTADDWVGGYYRGDLEWYGRAWVSVYGAQSDYPRAALAFTLDRAPAGIVEVALNGLDDELVDKATIAISVNDRQVYADLSPFANWDGLGRGENAAWTRVAISVSADLFGVGSNELAVANLVPAANFSAPPYVLLSDASMEFTFG